jgi:hypothetical protein
MVNAGADGRIMLMTGGLRIYQGMNIKIGSSRKKGDCTKKQSQETT